MSDHPHLTLPGSRRPKPAMPFAIGAKVVLVSCPSAPGVIRGTRGRKVLVEWSDLNYTGKHRPEALMLATEVEVKDEQKQESKSTSTSGAAKDRSELNRAHYPERKN
jgi:hypothetical protein